MIANFLVFVATPAWNITRYFTDMVIRTAPTFIGGWEGKEQIDICTFLLNVPSSLLIMDKNNSICDEKIRSYVDSRTVILFTFICGILSLKLPRCIVYICNVSKLNKKKINTAIKSQITKNLNESNRVLISSIAQIINLSSNSDAKLLEIEKLLVTRLAKNNLN
jgi:hypothetical protein